MSGIIAIGGVGRAIAARLGGEPVAVTVVLTDAITARVNEVAQTSADPLLITVLGSTRLTVGPLHRPNVILDETPPGAATGVLQQHIELAAELTRVYLRQSLVDVLVVNLFDGTLHRRTAAV